MKPTHIVSTAVIVIVAILIYLAIFGSPLLESWAVMAPEILMFLCIPALFVAIILIGIFKGTDPYWQRVVAGIVGVVITVVSLVWVGLYVNSTISKCVSAGGEIHPVLTYEVRNPSLNEVCKLPDGSTIDP